MVVAVVAVVDERLCLRLRIASLTERLLQARRHDVRVMGLRT
jgi:hypothetical protein